jgi:hypothetical protein
MLLEILLRRQAAQLLGDLQAQAQLNFLQLIGAFFALVVKLLLQHLILRNQCAREFKDALIVFAQFLNSHAIRLQSVAGVPEEFEPEG